MNGQDNSMTISDAFSETSILIWQNSFGPKDSQEEINAELDAFESAANSPDGLQAAINRVQIATDKLSSSMKTPAVPSTACWRSNLTSSRN